MLTTLLKDKRATSAVEFALIAPFLLLLVGSILAQVTSQPEVTTRRAKHPPSRRIAGPARRALR